ncbi:MAG: thiamine pyrophosphate-dependent enzyme [Lachnospiraceae bacterium]
MIYDTHPLYAGRPGTVGNRGGNFVVQNSDLLISFGCRMNIRQISYEWKKFAKYAYKIAIDIDENELKKPTLNIDYPIHADILDVFQEILQVDYIPNNNHEGWVQWCKNINEKYPIMVKDYLVKKEPINPYAFMDTLSKNIEKNDIIVASNGTACVCAFQAIEMQKGQRMFTNAGASSMGYGLPAAIGAAISVNNCEKIICLEGDGSIQMNIQELQTVVHHSLNIKIFWLNNDGYHSIRQTQAQSFKGEEKGYCGVSSLSGISFPSAKKIAEAYGIKYVLIDSLITITSKLKEVLNNEDPIICEVILDKQQAFEPKLSSKVSPDGTITSPSLEDMSPFLEEEEMNENMIAWKDGR